MTTPLEILKKAVYFFEKNSFQYCLIGGHAASLYRTNERLTKDVDFAVYSEDAGKARTIAEDVIKSLKLKPVIGFIPRTSKEDSRRGPVSLVTSKPQDGELTGIIDILLPQLPWVKNAVQRAQHNKINLVFAKVPVITPEDLIIAKCYALRNNPDRFQDLDDIKEIFNAMKDLDYLYLNNQLSELKLKIPEVLKKYMVE